MKKMLDNLFNKNKKDSTNFDVLTNDDFTHLQSDTLETGGTKSTEKSSLMRSSTSGSYKYSSTSSYESKHKRLPVIGNLEVKQQYKIIGVLGVLGIVVVAIGGFSASTASKHVYELDEGGYKALSASQELFVSIKKASIGNNEAFSDLSANLKIVSEGVQKINAEDNYLSASSDVALAEKIKSLNDRFNSIQNDVSVFTEQQDLLKNVSATLETFDKQVNTLSMQLERFASAQYQTGGSDNEIANVLTINTELKNLKSYLSNVLLSENIAQADLSQLTKSRNNIKNSLVEIYNGNKDKEVSSLKDQNLLNSFDKITKNWFKTVNTVDNVIANGNKIKKVKSLSDETEQKIITFNKDIKDLMVLIDGMKFNKHYLGYIAIVLGLIILIASAMSAIYAYLYEKENKSLLEKVEANKNQQAILRLLDELGPISDGDLTKTTTVTEEITGAIADSINMTIGDLANLVKKIKQSAENMKIKAEEANEISRSMLEENIKQAESIKQTGEQVLNISYAVNEISEKTAESAKVANDSVEVSVAGSQSVNASIESMNTIKVNIHDTGLLMKKLNDSSRQISEIIELLSDISEETSVLALNASVQAAKAGEAGKGFTIVANSIQELASKASDSTRKVGALVSTIQTDINAVSDSLTKTTNEVQKGTKLGEEAGQSLQKIQEVSDVLSSIIKNISEETKRHAEVANKVSIDIKDILAATTKAEDANIKTADVIREIAALSNSLDKAAQHFTVE